MADNSAETKTDKDPVATDKVADGHVMVKMIDGSSLLVPQNKIVPNNSGGASAPSSPVSQWSSNLMSAGGNGGSSGFIPLPPRPNAGSAVPGSQFGLGATATAFGPPGMPPVVQSGPFMTHAPIQMGVGAGRDMNAIEAEEMEKEPTPKSCFGKFGNAAADGCYCCLEALLLFCDCAAQSYRK